MIRLKSFKTLNALNFYFSTLLDFYTQQNESTNRLGFCTSRKILFYPIDFHVQQNTINLHCLLLDWRNQL